jgi:selenide,water dikinase
MDSLVRLTQYSHGAGCGCKIAPDVLAKILQPSLSGPASRPHPLLLVGNDQSDDAAAIDIEDGRVILSTTDFFMPIVDDPYDFGRVAATNAISDIYAMGGKPLMAIAILGWPINLLSPEIAADVIAGGRAVCSAAGIPLAGGHSIDAPEPIFGLAVTGIVQKEQLKRNASAEVGDQLFLTKPLGIGLLTTAEKQGKLLEEDRGRAVEVMCTLNQIGSVLGAMEGVNAMTDVTGFGLAGHLSEICRGANLAASINSNALPLLNNVDYYISEGCIPGGTGRNHQAFKDALSNLSDRQKAIICDPQTSGGLLVSVKAEAVPSVKEALQNAGLMSEPIGHLHQRSASQNMISVR